MGVFQKLYVIPLPSSDSAVIVWLAAVQEEKRWGNEEVLTLVALLTAC